MPRRILAASAVAGAGFGLLVAGVALVYVPAALIVAGGLLLVALVVDVGR